MDMTKAQAKELLGFTTDTELAEFFHVTKQAVGFWPDDKPMPEGRQWEIRARRPELFRSKVAA
jgi:hypothetical protein